MFSGAIDHETSVGANGRSPLLFRLLFFVTVKVNSLIV